MARLFLSVGSNIEPESNIQQCAAAIQTHFSHPVWSPVYRSAAVGMVGDDFLNAVVLAHTHHSITATIDLLRQIEHEHGRIRSENKFTSRTLDIDLLLYDDIVKKTVQVTLPRAELTTAAHVLKPLVDIEPDGVHPVLKTTYSQLLSNLEQQSPGSISSLSAVSIPIPGDAG